MILSKHNGSATVLGFHADCIPISDIKAAVCEAFGLLPLDMISERRGRKIARPRQVAMYLARQLTPHSFPGIGRQFGDRDHTTIMHAVATVERIMDEDHDFKDKVKTLQAKLVSTEKKLNCGQVPCAENADAPLESSMRYLRRIDDPSARKTIIMSKWERGEITPQQTERLIHEHGLENA